MADTVTVKSETRSREAIYVLTCISDGTGESNVVKIDKSTLTLAGVEPSKINIMAITSNIQGFTRVSLRWDRTSDVTIAVLGAGSFYEDFSEFNGLKDTGTGDTGDIILSTTGAIVGATYTITLRVMLV